MKRIFIVGVARSGTTLLQSMIAAHPDVYSLPETHLFHKTIPHPKIKRILFYAGKKQRGYVKHFLKQIQKTELYQEYQMNKFDKNAWIQYLISLMDALCSNEDKDIWVEKTPMHLYYADLLMKNDPGCKIIHVIREPLANIASLYDVSRTYPESFSQKSLRKAVKRYQRDIKISEKFLGRKNHSIVHYEKLVTHPENELKRICQELELSYDPAMLRYRDTINHLVFNDEKWKEQNKKQLELGNKVDKRLNNTERAYVMRRIKHFKNSLLDRYEKN